MLHLGKNPDSQRIYAERLAASMFRKKVTDRLSSPETKALCNCTITGFIHLTKLYGGWWNTIDMQSFDIVSEIRSKYLPDDTSKEWLIEHGFDVSDERIRIAVDSCWREAISHIKAEYALDEKRKLPHANFSLPSCRWSNPAGISW
jgi:hypothetical protein